VKHRKSNTGLIVIAFTFLCVICCACILLVFAFDNGDILSISTPIPIQVLDTPFPIPTLIALTYSAAGTQTAIADPVPLSTATIAPLIENIPTATIFIFQLQTNMAQPTQYIYSTNTPFSLATQPLEPTLQSTLPPQSEVCSCSIDYNCPDFSSHSEAQACFDYCKSLGYDDPSGLDRDDDNLACEDTNY